MTLKHLLAAAIALLLSVPVLAEPGVSDKEVLLGQSVALSGPAKELGSEMRSGALLYFEQVNASGGVHGRRIRSGLRQLSVHLHRIVEQHRVH